MRIATFNANSIRARLDIVRAWLTVRQPDVLCLQETKVRDEQFPRAPFLEIGYQASFRGEKAYNGVAILSRKAPDELRWGFDDGGARDETRLIRARFGDVWVVNTYVPQGREIAHEMFRYKLEWFARLRRLFERDHAPDRPLVWTGDLNVARAPEDVYDSAGHQEHVCHHPDVRHAFDAVLSWGLEDVFRRFHPEAGQYTFFDYRQPAALPRNRGWRIDYILATKPLARNAKDCFIDLDPRRAPRPSDHTFLAADF